MFANRLQSIDYLAATSSSNREPAIPLQLSMYNTRRPIDADATAVDMHNCVFPAPPSPMISITELDGKPSQNRRLIAVHPVLHVDTFGGAPVGCVGGIAEGKMVRHDMVSDVFLIRKNRSSCHFSTEFTVKFQSQTLTRVPW